MNREAQSTGRFAGDLLKALGIYGYDVNKIVITIEGCELVEVDVTFIEPTTLLNELPLMLKKYTLTEKPDQGGTPCPPL